MARIAGVNLPSNKHVNIALTAIYGIGNTTARKICSDLQIPPFIKLKDLEDIKLDELRESVSKLIVEGDLRRDLDEYQKIDRPWQLSGIETSSWFAGTRSEN